jgi:hypothetical protein
LGETRRKSRNAGTRSYPEWCRYPVIQNAPVSDYAYRKSTPFFIFTFDSWALIYVVLDKKVRNLVFFMYKSFMRWLTGLFIQIDPIGILKTYIDDLKKNLMNMSKQLAVVKGQMQRLKLLMEENKKSIENNLKLASKAKETDKTAVMILKSRKAGRLKESNLRYDELYKNWSSSTGF